MTPDPSAEPLPNDLADAAAEQLLGASGDDRATALAVLVAAHPHHAAALQRLADELAGAEAMLDVTFAGVRRDAPTQIGGHRVTKKLGEGAFGVVYLCAQERPVVREVAIKVLRPGAGDERTLRRFAAERQALATLSHASITQVFDAGELPDGRPYFVMEYVDGRTIRVHCEEKALPCDERLRLFVQVCRGVAHAHARGIVHRDLKPANVLVVDGDDGPLPKIIDFGIAKALFATAGSDTSRTDPGRVVGTPGYMSPEQAAGRIDEIDVRADVFALGVMLYELLTGDLPWSAGAAATDSDPLWPSQRVAPSTQRRQFAAALRGDLDWITLKALARERDDRYGSVADLVADIERHLRGETVSVGPPSLRYRLRKFVRRNRAAVTMALGGAVAVAGLLVAVAYGSSKQAEVADARSAAAASHADAREVVARLLQRANDPALFGTAQGDEVRKALSVEALHFAERLLASEPEDALLQGDRCEALLSISQVHWLLGEPTRAQVVAAEAVHIGEHLFAAEPTNVRWRGLLGDALRKLGRAIGLGGNHEAAMPAFVAAVDHLAACAAAEPDRYTLAHSAALRECAVAVPTTEHDRAIALCRHARDLLEPMRVDPRCSEEVREEYVAAGLYLARRLFDARRPELAKEELARLEPTVDVAPDTAFRERSEFHALRGAVLWSLGERESTMPDVEAAVTVADAWCQAQPRRNIAHRVRIIRLSTLGSVRNYLGAFDASSSAFRRSIEAAEALAHQFPEDPTSLSFLCARLCTFAFVLRDRFRQQDLAEAAACVTRAIEVEKAIPAGVVSGRTPRWQLLTTLAGIEESRGAADTARWWGEVDASLPAWQASWDGASIEHFLAAVTGIARSQLRAGDVAKAERRLADARALVAARPDHDKRLVEVEWLTAGLAGANGDHAGAAAAAQRILDVRDTWFARRRAADCMHLAWRTASAQPDAESATVASYRERASQWYAMVVRTLDPDIETSPDDPWYVLPWGFSNVRLAELAAAVGDTAAARAFLAAALPRLEAVRGDAQHDEWDDGSFQAGCALRDRL